MDGLTFADRLFDLALHWQDVYRCHQDERLASPRLACNSFLACCTTSTYDARTQLKIFHWRHYTLRVIYKIHRIAIFARDAKDTLRSLQG